eukprot:SRR837773.9640.p2 GENE.SRR837773.9640~~SRR837773.9640.p2  ORF type:complete len:178 (-),score=52.22 SRR837773.9640:24-509(-)
MDLSKSALLAALPFVTMSLCGFTCGRVGDALVARGWQRLSVRRMMMVVSHVGPAACLLVLTQLTDPYQAVKLLMVLLGLHAFNAAGYHSHIQDVAAARAGTISGITNGLGMVCSSMSTVAVAYVVQQTGSFNPVFVATAGLYCLGCAVFCCCVSGKKLFSD